MGSASGDSGDPPDSASFDEALGQPAYALAATRATLRRSSALVAFGVVSAVVLVGLGARLWWVQHTLTNLATGGVHTTATVDSVNARSVAREHHVIGYIDTSFTVDGQPRTARFDVSTHVVQYHNGDKVEVAYAAGDPGFVDLVNDPAASRGFLPWELSAAFGVVAALMSGIAIRHLRSYRQLLKTNEWLAVPAVLKATSPRVRGRGTTVVELGEASSPERVVGSTVGIRALPPTVEPVAWVAGWGRRRFVVAPPGGHPLLLMHRLSDVGVDAEPIRPAPETGPTTETGGSVGSVDPHPQDRP